MSNNKEETIQSLPEWVDDPKPTYAGWYCLGNPYKGWPAAFATKTKPKFIKRFFMKTLLDFYWVTDEEFEQLKKVVYVDKNS